MDSAAFLRELGGKERPPSPASALLVLVFLMFFVLVAPLPILVLTFLIEPLVSHIGLVPLLQPVSVGSIFPFIPVVVIAVIGIVDSMLPLLLLVPFVIVLWSLHRQRSQRRHQSSRQEH